MKYVLSTKKRGFTLIELLVVVAIIGILATVVLASLNKARNAAKGTVVTAEVRSLKQAFELYYLDHDEYPVIDSTAAFNYVTALCAGGGSGSGTPGYDEFYALMDGYIDSDNIDSDICIYYSSNTNTPYTGNVICHYTTFERGQGYILLWYTPDGKIIEPWHSGRVFGPPYGAEHCATHEI